MLRIIYANRNQETTSEHAARLIRSLQEYEDKYPHAASPRNVSDYAAVFPVICDNCGDTFWANSPHAIHPRCRGTRSQFGF